ncbi:hypothetical protein TNCV_2341181 [Trichonephila clavipes]|nr:hypothetical protein TNCV_2341181 [Trichonephila clavipes]
MELFSVDTVTRERLWKEIAGGLARETTIKILCIVAALLFSEIATRVKQNVSSPLKLALVHEWRMMKIILVLLCFGKAVGEMKLHLLGLAVDILELNGMWRVLEFTLLV